MATEIIVALVTGALSVVSVIATNLIGNSKIQQDIKTHQAVTDEKITSLSRKVDKHNEVIERTFKLEKDTALLDEQIKVANHRIEDLERKVG